MRGILLNLKEQLHGLFELLVNYPFIRISLELHDIFTGRGKIFSGKTKVHKFTASYLFVSYHSVFIILSPLFYLMSPFVWIKIKKLSVAGAFMPALLVSAFLLVSAVFDKMIEYRSGPGAKEESLKNTSLYYHLPFSSALLFFVIHPFFGYFMMFLSWIFSMTLTIHSESLNRNLTPAAVLIYYFWSIILLLIPLAVFAFGVSIIRGFFLIGELF